MGRGRGAAERVGAGRCEERLLHAASGHLQAARRRAHARAPWGPRRLARPLPMHTCPSCACVSFLAVRAWMICFFSSVDTRSSVEGGRCRGRSSEVGPPDTPQVREAHQAHGGRGGGHAPVPMQARMRRSGAGAAFGYGACMQQQAVQWRARSRTHGGSPPSRYPACAPPRRWSWPVRSLLMQRSRGQGACEEGAGDSRDEAGTEGSCPPTDAPQSQLTLLLRLYRHSSSPGLREGAKGAGAGGSIGWQQERAALAGRAIP